MKRDYYRQVDDEYRLIRSAEELENFQKRWISPWVKIQERATWDPLIRSWANRDRGVMHRLLLIRGLARFAEDRVRYWREQERILNALMQ